MAAPPPQAGGIAIRRLPVLFLSFLALLLGAWVGLWRVGLRVPLPRAELALAHGPLMVCGFLGTLIAVERAVALGRGWAWASPIASVIGTVALVGGAPPTLAVSALLVAAVVLMAASASALSKDPSLHVATLVVGAATLVAGDALWLAGRPLPDLVPLWAAFLVLTIAGERLELGRVLKPSRLRNPAFVVATLPVALGPVAAALWPARALGVRTFGVGLLLLFGWLLRWDVARRTVRLQGLTRYIAVCLLAGYAWLLVGATLLLWHGRLVGGLPSYDAALHALFLGFTFSMIFGHAPIILPAVTRAALPYRSRFYLHVVLLHGSLVVRIVGDLTFGTAARAWGSALNALSLLAFLGSTAAAIVGARRAATHSKIG